MNRSGSNTSVTRRPPLSPSSRSPGDMKPFPQWKQGQNNFPSSTKSSSAALMNRTHQGTSQGQHRQQKGLNPPQYAGTKASSGRLNKQN